MDKSNKGYVYHGSNKKFQTVIPKKQIRTRITENGKQKVIFSDISFHATLHKWIAIAYTFNPNFYKIDGRIAHYSIGVDLYKHKKELEIFGFENLEKSLEKMYGNDGYLFTFNKNNFFRIKGLGNLEVITKDKINPVKVEKIDNPVAELKKLGVQFKFIDLAKPENKEWCNYD